MKTKILSAALLMSMVPAWNAPQAAGVTVYASEVTQILNNVELVMQYLEQVKMVRNQLKELDHWKQTLERMDAGRVEGILKNRFGMSSMDEFRSMLTTSSMLSETLDELREDMVTINYEQGVAAHTIQRLRERGHNVTTGDYVSAMYALSKEQAEGYGDRYERFGDSLKSAQGHIARARRLADEAPVLQGEVEGLAALNAGHAQMQVQLAELTTVMATTGQLQAMEASREEPQRLREEANREGSIAAIRGMLRKADDE
jgi:P-type conjugative transfer protein TrbJ